MQIDLLRPWDCKIFPKATKTLCFGGSDGVGAQLQRGVEHNMKQLHHGMDVIFAGKPMYEQKEQEQETVEANYSSTGGTTKKSAISDAKKGSLSSEGQKKPQGKAGLYAKKKKPSSGATG